MALRAGSSLLNSFLGLQMRHAAPPLAAHGAAILARAFAADASNTSSSGTAIVQQKKEEKQPQQTQQQQEQQQQQQQDKQRQPEDSEWTEVVDEKTGQAYFWNESTGETTDIGEPRPKTRFRDQSFRGANDARFQEGWREPPVEDRTYAYSIIGIAVGMLAGWATQYMH